MHKDINTALRFMDYNLTRTLQRAARVTSPDRVEATALLAANILRRNVPGDFVEAGVYFGVSSILMMRGLLSSPSGERLMWACDSFEGLPLTELDDRSNEMNCTRKLSGGQMCMRSESGFGGAYRATLSQFKHNMRNHIPKPTSVSVAWDSRLRIVKGWFNATLPAPGMKRFSFLRIDGDLYASTRDALAALYPLLSDGGYAYVDDYGSFGGCGKAVDDYLESRGCGEQLTPIWERSNQEGGWRKPDRSQGFEAVWWAKKSC